MAEWICRNIFKFIDQVDRWDIVLRKPENITAVGNTLAILKAFKTAWAAFTDADSTKNRIAKNLARAAAEKEMRYFASAYVRYNPNVDDATGRELGLPPADVIRTPAPWPPFAPFTVVETTRTHHEHKISAINPTTETRQKPARVKGIVVAWQVGGERPASAEDMPKMRSSPGPLVLSHGERNAGKNVYYATCYENSRYERGNGRL